MHGIMAWIRPGRQPRLPHLEPLAPDPCLLACLPQIVGFLICMGIAAMAILGLVVPKGNAVQAGWTAVDNVSSYVQKVRRA